ncbi:MAG: glycosyltransferase [Chromatiales bacterium]|nr:glycosyltransferase [Chromatiales bacterium]
MSPADTRYIAFLDSDDRLDENYLGHAVQALDRGYDLFFGNSRRADIPRTRFDWDADLNVHLDPNQHRLLNEERALYEFTGDFFDFILRRSNFISGSAIIYRYAIGGSIRFNERIYNGQDRIFKLNLCQKIKKAAFSTQVYAEEGKGVNIFDNAGWGSERALSRISSYIDMNRVILNEFSLNKIQRKHVCRHLADTRYAFTASLLHQLRCGQNIDWKLVRKTFGQDPSTLGLFLPNLIKIMATKIRISESGT